MPIRLSPGAARPVAAVALAGASLVTAAAVGSIFLSTARDSWAAIAAAGPAGPADGILLVVALGGTLLTLWLGLGLALSALSALPGAVGSAFSLLAARFAPAAARKVVAFILGTTLTAAFVPGTDVARASLDSPRPAFVAAAQHAVSSLADAAPDASFRLVSDAVTAADVAPSPSWSPERPAPLRAGSTRAGSPRAGSTRAGSRKSSASPAGAVVVQRGDTLWSIAADRLGQGASSADIDAEWHRWFAANRDVIGDDANFIAPGQLLNPPASSSSPSSPSSPRVGRLSSRSGRSRTSRRRSSTRAPPCSTHPRPSSTHAPPCSRTRAPSSRGRWRSTSGATTTPFKIPRTRSTSDRNGRELTICPSRRPG